MMRVLALGVALFISTPFNARIGASGLAAFSFRQHPGAQLPLDAKLVDQGGRQVRLGAEFGRRPTVLVLEYLRCRNLCSLVLSGATAAMARARLTPGKDVNLVAISIDPRDTATDAAASAAMYSRRFPDPAVAATGVRFLIGSPGEVKRIAEAVGFPYRLDPPSGQFAHPAGFVVATPDGRIARYVLGLNPDPRLLKQAIGEAAREQVAPAAHPLLCLCFGYDPDEGSVAALTWQLVRSASLVLVLACAAFVGFLSLRRRSA
jgi:protein SCO1